jgi:hypothetical protein
MLPRVLILIRDGVTGFVADENVDVETLDFDEAKFKGEYPLIPAHFSDLGVVGRILADRVETDPTMHRAKPVAVEAPQSTDVVQSDPPSANRTEDDLNRLLVATQRVFANWSSGNLASAMRSLQSECDAIQAGRDSRLAA